jgi:hypothetical protein
MELGADSYVAVQVRRRLPDGNAVASNLQCNGPNVKKGDCEQSQLSINKATRMSATTRYQGSRVEDGWTEGRSPTSSLARPSILILARLPELRLFVSRLA